MDKMLDWNKRQKVTLVVGLIALVGSLAVLGLTIQRIQNLRSTVERPKAATCDPSCAAPVGEACKTPECAGCPACTGGGGGGGGSGQNVVGGCKYKDDTPWDSRCSSNPVSGQTVRLYDGSSQIGYQTINSYGWLLNGSPPLSRGKIYSLTVDVPSGYTLKSILCTNKYACLASDGNGYCRSGPGDACSTSLPAASIISGNSVNVNIPSESSSFVDIHWVFTVGGGGSWYTANSPIGGVTVLSLTPNFTWSGTMPSNNNYQRICLGTWVSTSSCESVGCFGTGGANSYTHPTALSPNTTYGWTVYSAYTPGTLNVTNMTGGCQQFKTPAACPTGQTPCNSVCKNLTSDPVNCGSCGNVCTSTNGTASCSNSTCGITCYSGYGNCDNNPTNGCEVPLNTTSNCGTCGNVCNSTNGTATCSSSTCGITCNSDYGNCDSNAANGCETPLNTTTNCAVCGRACPTGQTCTNGSCSGTTTCTSDPDCSGGNVCAFP